MTADQNGLPFAIVRRGYDRAQVEDRFTSLLAELDAARGSAQDAVADRERISRELDTSRGETRAARAEVTDTRSEVDRLAGQVAELSTIPSTVDGMSDRLQQMVRVAQDEVNDMRARATRGAAQILGMAQAEADELRDSAHQERRTFESEQRSAQDELRVRLEETRTQLAALREEADGQRARLDAELAERRARDEQTLAAEMADRREVMLADLANVERRQREDAQRIVDAASARARTLVDEAAAETDRTRSHTREQVLRANEELEQLRALQAQVAEQLSGVRSLLDWTLPRINPGTGGAHGGEAALGDPADAPVATGAQVAELHEDSRGAHVLDEPEPDAPALTGRPDPAAYDRTGLDTPLYGATAASGDDTGVGTVIDTRPDPRTDAWIEVDGQDAASDVAEVDADEAGLDDADDDEVLDRGATRGGRHPHHRGDQADVKRPSPVARAGARR